MTELIQLTQMILVTFVQAIFNPFLWVVMLLVGLQFKRMAETRAELFGGERESVWRPTLQATFYGVIGGLIGSFLMVALGISLSGIGIGTLWLVAIMLMLISPRFLCFAYAGGIISLSHLLFGWPEVNIPELIGLVALLHMIEAILILLSGHLGAVPIFTKDRNGRLIGGFTLQKFWPIPIVVLFAMTSPESYSSAGGVDMPDWWPIISSGLTDLEPNIFYTMIPVIAGLGYADLALARKPYEKTKLSALYLGIYSVILLLLAILASEYFYPFALLAALFAPLGHEWVIGLGQRLEYEGKPLYVAPERGIMILDVDPKGVAWQIGLESGDILLYVNNYPVNNRFQLTCALEGFEGPMEIEYLKDNLRMEREIISLRYEQPLGIIPVPEGDEKNYVEIRTDGLIKRWFNKIFNRE